MFKMITTVIFTFIFVIVIIIWLKLRKLGQSQEQNNAEV